MIYLIFRAGQSVESIFAFDAMSTAIIKLTHMKATLIIVSILAIIFASCASDPGPQPEQETQEVETVVEKPVEEQAVEPEEIPEPSVAESFEVSEELYQQTFEEIEALIEELNSVISRKQFDKWLGYLSRNYIDIYNSPEQLDEISQYRQLKDNGIYLKSLRDYFDWVVVPSRSKATLDEIVFLGENEVIAYSTFEGKRAKLYELERIDGEWKVTVW